MDFACSKVHKLAKNTMRRDISPMQTLGTMYFNNNNFMYGTVNAHGQVITEKSPIYL